MQDEDKRALSKVRIDRAEECLKEAQSLFEAESYKGAANRLYYSIFHAMRATLALDGVDMKHHSGVISEFRRRYIKTKKLDASLSKIISVLSGMRSESDYDDFYVLSKTEISNQFENVRFFIDSVKNLIDV